MAALPPEYLDPNTPPDVVVTDLLQPRQNLFGRHLQDVPEGVPRRRAPLRRHAHRLHGSRVRARMADDSTADPAALRSDDGRFGAFDLPGSSGFLYKWASG